MNPVPDTCWAEWGGHFVYEGKPMPSGKPPWLADAIAFNHITVFPEGWDKPVRHLLSGCRWNKHGHNWYGTTRLDFWINPVWDPYEWHGHLITGGINTGFRLRRTRSRDIFHRIDSKLPPIREVTRETIGSLTAWRASFHKRPDVWAACLGDGRWGDLDWHLAPDRDELIRHIALKRLGIVA
jgi:hypothetical protein